MRGGAFNNNDNNVRCAARNRNNPNNDNRNNGFRVVLSTLSMADAVPPGLPGGCKASGSRRKWPSLPLAALVNHEPGKEQRPCTLAPARALAWCRATFLN